MTCHHENQKMVKGMKSRQKRKKDLTFEMMMFPPEMAGEGLEELAVVALELGGLPCQNH